MRSADWIVFKFISAACNICECRSADCNIFECRSADYNVYDGRSADYNMWMYIIKNVAHNWQWSLGNGTIKMYSIQNRILYNFISVIMVKTSI